jgi:hypothetical protein
LDAGRFRRFAEEGKLVSGILKLAPVASAVQPDPCGPNLYARKRRRRMMSSSSSRTTRDHDEIRRWAESRKAIPCEVAGTERGGEPGILRFEFPTSRNHNDDKLQEISWEDFFEKFDERGLELLYQETTADGERSNFNKLIYPEDEHASKKKDSSSKSKTKHAA